MDRDLIKNKIQGSLIGGAIGDALGYQIEFDIGIREKQVTKFRGDLGVISDDTQMTLFTANALLWYYTQAQLGMDVMSQADAVYFGYLDWYKTQTHKGSNGAASFIKEVWLKTGSIVKHKPICWLGDVADLHKRQAPGNTCLSSLRSGNMGSIEKPINNSKGCGGVMRIAPCGLLNDDPDVAGYLAAQSAAITHGHPSSNLASYMCAALISILTYQDVSIEDAVNLSLQLTKKNSDKLGADSDCIAAFVRMIIDATTLSKQNTSDPQTIQKIGGGWTADDALAIAIYSCLKYKTFEDIIICAANHDGDSDSTAAIAGNIIGASIGFDAIPSYYIDNVELKDTILEVADDVYSVVAKSDVENDENWMAKYN